MRLGNFALGIAFAWTLAPPAFAQPDGPAVWYRASETCPDGREFLGKLAETSRKARLAQAGDHIDFVVTLVADGKQTVGRLERQTDAGVVAIRELRDATCRQVADALALSLGLAMTPGQSNAEPVSSTPNDTAPDLPAPSSDAAPTQQVPSPAPSPAPPSAAVGTKASVAHTAAADSAAAPSPPRPAWSLGAEVDVMYGITPHPLPRGELFVDFRPALRAFLPNLSLRGSIVGATGSTDTALGEVRRWILAGRAEACPVAWEALRFDLRPCAAFELGSDSVSSEAADSAGGGIWAAPGGRLRLGFALKPQLLSLEASGGALIPLIRKEIFAGSQSLYRDAPAVFHAGVGLSLRLP